ncbi:DUF159 family protein [Geothrix limicola]|uniref:Abasic site processing protein n=1 Tax=Geothrix limicola TaxID=2927978 RepID=A0ABQ5QD42_9BACT|nr:SOS response-associated peptidase [Geothrix limicola]GLH72050.1 DUF159 family protein [Geothrix limicola]
MCGRMVSAAIKRMLREAFPGRPMKELIKEFMDRWNVSPGQKVPVIEPGEEWTVTERMWGFQPGWSKRPLINARAETLHELKTWRGPFKDGRLVVPATGFYEWPVIAGRKRAMFIHPAEGHHFLFAGLGLRHEGEDVCAVITTFPNKIMEELHPKSMPAILSPEAAEAWLDPNTSQADLQALLGPCPDEWIEAYEVSSAVGNVKAQGPELILPIA